MDDSAANDQDPPEQTAQSDQPPPRSAAEWLTLAVSTLIVAALIGAALYEHLGNDEPPGVRVEIQVDLARVERRETRYYVPFTVTNTGAEPAEAVSLVFEIKQGEEVLEETSTEIAFLPNSGSAGGEIVTELDPAGHEIVGRIGSVMIP